MIFLNNIPEVIFYEIKSYVIFTPKENQELKKAVNLWCNKLEKEKHISYMDIFHLGIQNILLIWTTYLNLKNHLIVLFLLGM